MVLMMQKEVTQHRAWCSEEEFLNYLAIAQSSPGPMAVNTSMLIGYHVSGAKGLIVSALGSTLPSYIILLLVAVFFGRIDDNPTVRSIFMGIRPAVVALILYPVFSFAKHVKKIEYPLFIAIATLIYIGISPLWFIAIAVAYGLYRARKGAQA